MSIVTTPSRRRGKNSRRPGLTGDERRQIRRDAIRAGIDPIVAATEDPRDLAVIIPLAPRLRLVPDVDIADVFDQVEDLAPNLAFHPFRSEGVRADVADEETADERASTLTFLARLRGDRDRIVEPASIATPFSTFGGDVA